MTKIIVTEDDIKQGIKNDPFYCPIKLAADKSNLAIPVHEVGENILLLCNNKAIELPDIAKNFIHDFDCGYSVKPFEFDIELS